MSRWILDRRNVAIEHHKPSNRDAVFVKKLNFEALKNTHKINVMSFTQPRALERCRDHFVLKETAMAHGQHTGLPQEPYKPT
jgi:hypothetical protein